MRTALAPRVWRCSLFAPLLPASRTRKFGITDQQIAAAIGIRRSKSFASMQTLLTEFARNRPISAIMGAHIELSRTGEPFPAGATFQPGEARLPLAVEDLPHLDEKLQQAGEPVVISTGTPPLRRSAGFSACYRTSRSGSACGKGRDRLLLKF